MILILLLIYISIYYYKKTYNSYQEYLEDNNYIHHNN